MRSGGTPSLGHQRLDAGEDRVVAAARAPARFLVGLEVGLGQGRQGAAVAAAPLLLPFSLMTVPPGSPAPSLRRGSAGPRLCCSRSRRSTNSERMMLSSWPRVELGDQDLREAPDDLAGVGRQRVHVAQVGDRDRDVLFAHAAGRGADHAVGRAPAEHQQLGALVGVDLERGSSSASFSSLRRAQLRHQRVVEGVIADVAAAVLLLEAAEAVLEAGGSGDRPGPGAALVAEVGHEVVAGVRRLGEVGVDLGQLGAVGDAPGLRGVGEEGVAEQDHRRPVADRGADRFDRHREAVGRRRGGEDGDRVLAVAPVDRHQQVALLGLGRHPGRGPGPLDVDDHHRQLDHRREADRLRLEVHAGAAGRGHPELAGERRPERHVGGGELVLGLDRADAEAVAAGEVREGARRRG